MLYGFAKFVCRAILLLRRWEITGNGHLPPGQGMIVVANHVSYWDPVVVGCALNRRIYFMAKAELFDIPVLAVLINKLGAFPVQRDGADRSSIRRALELLDAGKVVGIFPEGTRSKTGELLNPHMGAAMLAIKGGVPLLPVAVSGTRGFWGKVRVNLGQPINTSASNRRKVSRTELAELSHDVMEEIKHLLVDIEK
ncbi:1-acyl-sn-glycerol-3-phosphate acyltransferase [Desulfotomaculum arcticum]|uniref:1-acyl-sn-glycerol-3-phosphate acyltransferase n=1 Tax=Desulfotruncus arcticus DSM 17038 TaxID=1121424 RepID=A0A1I2MVV5_9FIRM|nr:lysophospholipid acyltransferase family protein [Desulfotruncus arcticus]SFF94789.1 1-acyl-sn-glycerol-3-phosphate acyltransferase [Desulfotomaculum arcticum] [Desulfotruncus arcticus DSM 17038]